MTDQLYRMVDEILWNDWDPIGVNDIAPRNEYQSYVPTLYKMLINNASAIEMANKLGQIATERMGLDRNPELELQVANKLLSIKNAT